MKNLGEKRREGGMKEKKKKREKERFGKSLSSVEEEEKRLREIYINKVRRNTPHISFEFKRILPLIDSSPRAKGRITKG